MFNRGTKKPEPHALDESISNLISELAGLEAGTEARTLAVADLKILMELRLAERASVKPFVSADTVATIAGNLLGIGLILGFEKANVLTTKSLSFVPKIQI